MLKYKVGDLIKAAQSGEVNAIGHGCNCYNTMGSGIAPLIKAAFPQAYIEDCKTGKGDKSKLGTVTVALCDFGVVFNLYSQFGFWGRNKGLRDLDYNALHDAFVDMALLLKQVPADKFADIRVGLPKIGAGLAGGNWSIISVMIEETLVKAGVDVTIYVLNEKEIPNG